MSKKSAKTGQKRKEENSHDPIGFAELPSRAQMHLRNRAPNPKDLPADEIEGFREEFLSSFPELTPVIPDHKAMRRLMKTGTMRRHAHRRAMKSRRIGAPTSM
jgi:hypothetical protein